MGNKHICMSLNGFYDQQTVLLLTDDAQMPL